MRIGSIRQFLLLLVLLLLSNITLPVLAKPERYDKHIIIAVDQTIVDNPRMVNMYYALSALLRNEHTALSNKNFNVPDNFNFDPKKDEVSLYTFCLPGSDRLQILSDRQRGKPAEYLFEEFLHSFIQENGDFHASGLSLDAFINTNLKNIFFGQSPLAQRWSMSKGTGLTFSHYVYPSVLRFVNTDVPASQFILIVVSDFVSGAYGANANLDEFNMQQMMGNKFMTITSMMNSIGSPFVRVDYLDIRYNNNVIQGTQDNGVRAMGYSLLMKKTVQKSAIFLMNDLTLRQLSKGGTKYSVKPVTISFNKDVNTEVQKVMLSVYDADGALLCEKQVVDSLGARGCYEGKPIPIYNLPGMELELKGVGLGTKLRFEYTFYTISKDDAGRDIMPFTLSASRIITIDSNVINHGYTKMIIIICFILAILGLIAWYIWKKRGKTRSADFTYRIDRVSKMRYMDVKDDSEQGLHVLNYDVWYMDDGDYETNIHVRGDVQLKSKPFAKNYALLVSCMVKDLDENYDFTFRPGGKDHTGSDREKDKFYQVPLNSDGHFEFDVVAYVDSDDNGNQKQPDFTSRENILKLGLSFKVELIDKTGKVLKVTEVDNYQKPYEFIVKKNIPNRDLWMAFDPGTNGSCVAFGEGGTPDDMSNIHLAKNYDVSRGWQPIIPSYITISDNDSTLNKFESQGVEALLSPRDYEFGNAAYQKEYELNRFQSIKKLLGYNKTKLKLFGRNDRVTEIEGRDLAYLIIRGLLGNFEKFLKDNKEDSTKVALEKFMPDGLFKPSRAIVAVPNNYTLTKVRDMVDSIKRTGKFREVHYLYEAEGVLMTYLGRNWKDLSKKQDMTFVVFDMGGATINATAFRIKVNTEVSKSGNLFTRDIEVKTVSKIGYSVGGDNIDYAIMQVLYHIPTVLQYFRNDEKKIREHQELWKPSILKFVDELKMMLIDKQNGEMKTGNPFVSPEDLWGVVTNKFKEWGIMLTANDEEAAVPDDFWSYIQGELSGRETMKRYVLSKVKDAVMELINGNKAIEGTHIELIFSGRSTLYPGIQETVLDELCNKKYGCTCQDRWHGFDADSSSRLDPEKVKTAVVQGACWYAMWSGRIVMKHDIVTSTFGYIDMVNNEATFIPVVTKNTPFESNGHKKEAVDIQDPMLKNVKFIQMLGSNYGDIIRDDIRYKMNPLVEVTGTDINGVIDSVEIDVDDKNNFAYQLNIAGQKALEGHYEAADTDILDENSPEYAFAAMRTKKRPEIPRKSGIGRRRGGGLG